MSNPLPKSSLLKWILVLIVLAVITFLAWSNRGAIMVALGLKKEEELTPEEKGTTEVVAKATSYPVSPASDSSAIYQGFKDSGYLASLQSSVSSGLYPSSYLTDAQKDPARWLASHPYLYTRYPEYFRAS